jgi:large subunit ribosomal protein L24
MNLKLKKGDLVVVLTGKDRGKRGKITAAFPRSERVVVEGVNLVKRHQRSRRAGQKGQRVTIAAPIHVSNVQLICPSCRQPARVRIRRAGEKRERICAKCGKAVAEK